MATYQDDNLLDLEPLPEGEETPPPFVKTMSIVRWIILGSICLFALVMVLGYFGLSPLASAETKSIQYHCPMHPTYISSQPGECPICGMNLVPIATDTLATSKSAAQAQPAADTTPHTKAHKGQYFCPMDPEVVSDTAGRCPVCGMKLRIYEGEPEQPSMATNETAPHTKAHKGQYYCPMDPDVVSDTAGRCPTCGMKLEIYQGDGEPTGMESGKSSVPGLVEVTIEQNRLQLIGLKTARVIRRPLSSTISAVGYIAADEGKISAIQLRTSGYVKKLYIDQTGQSVRAGQPVLTIYSQDLYQAEQDYLSALESAGHAAVDPGLTQMRSQVVAAARERLRLLSVGDNEIKALETSGKGSAEVTLNSPFNGVVIEKNVAQGQTVSADQSLLTLADLRTVWFLADLNEQDLATIKVGQSVDLNFTSAGLTRTGKVAFIYPLISSETRTARIRVELTNQDLSLRPGMYGTLAMASSGPEKLVVPADAVLDGGKTKYAFVVHNKNQFEPRLITVGTTSDDWMEVTSGLVDGDEVVTSANFLIDSESRLKAAISGMSGNAAQKSSDHSH
jgi:membrane fusion protein, copper/silver efflux system